MYFNLLDRSILPQKQMGKIIIIILISCLFLVFLPHRVNKIRNLDSSEQTLEENFDDDVDETGARSVILDLVANNNTPLSTLLLNKHIDPKEVSLLTKELKKRKLSNQVFKGDKLKIGLKITQHEDVFSISSIGLYSFKSAMQMDVLKQEDNFIIQKKPIELDKSFVKISTPINFSIFETLRKLNIPVSAINELIKAYSHEIDFQRQVKQSDKIELIVEKYSESDGDLFYYGHIAFAKLTLGKDNYELYRYASSNNSYGYFSEDGKTCKRNLLKNPVQAARISSYFGNRKHPILGYTRMHKGIDFAAAKGTPIYSAGDGTITAMGKKGGYGNFIKIRHSSTLSTLYAHISKFHPSIKIGSKIKQGKTIAYVGSSGIASGPHLHYEVHINGRPVNPLSVKTIASTHLSKAELKKFAQYKDYLKEIRQVLEVKNTYVLGKITSKS